MILWASYKDFLQGVDHRSGLGEKEHLEIYELYMQIDLQFSLKL